MLSLSYRNQPPREPSSCLPGYIEHQQQQWSVISFPDSDMFSSHERVYVRAIMWLRVSWDQSLLYRVKQHFSRQESQQIRKIRVAAACRVLCCNCSCLQEQRHIVDVNGPNYYSRRLYIVLAFCSFSVFFPLRNPLHNGSFLLSYLCWSS